MISNILSSCFGCFRSNDITNTAPNSPAATTPPSHIQLQAPESRPASQAQPEEHTAQQSVEENPSTHSSPTGDLHEDKETNNSIEGSLIGSNIRITTWPNRPDTPKQSTPRVDSWPERSESFRVVVVTKFEGHTDSFELDIPPRSATKDNYKLIESTTKKYALDICNGSLAEGKQLSLAYGLCEISCTAERSPSQLEETKRLERWEDWDEITRIVTNWEATGHKNLSVVITRHIEITIPPITMADYPPPTRLSRDWLFQELSTRSSIILPQNLGTFIPNDEIQRLTTHEIIKAVMKDEHDIPEDKRDDLADYAHSKAPSLFLILIRLRLNLKVLWEAQDVGITDEGLPFAGTEATRAPWIKDAGQRTVWEADLHRYERDFYAATFHGTAMHQNFGPQVVIPYTYKEECGRGAFSIVYAVQLQASHQKIYRLPGNENPKLALKSIDRRKTQDDAFKHEQFLLKGMLDTSHLHIIELLATYRQHELWHFLFPLAECNLEQYMNSNEPLHSKKYIRWMLNQIAGLAGGLQLIHDNSRKVTPEAAQSLEPGGRLELKAGNRPVGTGYHHDLKPQNILHFKELRTKITTPSPELGVYQIADFGVGKFHGFLPNSHDPSKGTQHPRGTPTYAAPESRIPSLNPGSSTNRAKLHLSRPYDVWSFGCVVMEMMVWLILGNQEWIAFNTRRYGNVQEGSDAEESDAFWIADENFKSAKVRVEVQNMLDTLRASKLANQSTALALMVDLVVEILDVNPKTRIWMSAVMEKLETIVNAIELDNDFDGRESPVSPTGRTTPKVTIEEPDKVQRTHARMPSEGLHPLEPSSSSRGRNGSLQSSMKGASSRPPRSIPQESRPPVTRFQSD